MSDVSIFSQKNLGVAIDTISLIKSQLKEEYWKNRTGAYAEERQAYWKALTENYSKRLLKHIGVDPLVIAVVKQVLSMFEVAIPAEVMSVIRLLLKQIGVNV